MAEVRDRGQDGTGREGMGRSLDALQLFREVAQAGGQFQLRRDAPGHFAEAGVVRVGAIVRAAEEGVADTGVQQGVLRRQRAEGVDRHALSVGGEERDVEIRGFVLTVAADDEIHRKVEVGSKADFTRIQLSRNRLVSFARRGTPTAARIGVWSILYWKFRLYWLVVPVRVPYRIL